MSHMQKILGALIIAAVFVTSSTALAVSPTPDTPAATSAKKNYIQIRVTPPDQPIWRISLDRTKPDLPIRFTISPKIADADAGDTINPTGPVVFKVGHGEQPGSFQIGVTFRF